MKEDRKVYQENDLLKATSFKDSIYKEEISATQIEDKASIASASSTFFLLFPFSPLAMSCRIHGGEGYSWTKRYYVIKNSHFVLKKKKNFLNFFLHIFFSHNLILFWKRMRLNYLVVS